VTAPIRDLHLLPKTRDSLSFLYVEHAIVDQEDRAIAVVDARGRVPVPCAALTLLMLGPGTTITHAAIRNLAETGCMVAWTGEEGVRLYAAGTGETRSARKLLRQAAAWADEAARLRVIRRMYEIRFAEPLAPDLTLRQVRGREGIRVRETYAALSRATGVRWTGRTYRRDRWTASDPVNRALSAANSALYGVVHSAIIAAGYSPAIAFIHTGKQLSFVYDIADLYKTEVSIPAAFWAAAEGSTDVERRVRLFCRDFFHSSRLVERVVADIERVLAASGQPETLPDDRLDEDPALPGELWDPDGLVAGGGNYADQDPAY
jgi:CRISPR-associated protein Cas1